MFLGFKLKTLFANSVVFLVAFFFLFECLYSNTPAHETSSLEAGFRQMYNLDFSAAHKTFDAWQQLHPESPLGAASNAAAYLFDEFERLRVLDLDLFTDNHRLDSLEKPLPDPKIKIAFEKELNKADDLASRILAQSSNDCDALFAKTLTDGLRGNYAALIAKQKRDALDFLKSSRSIAERLVTIDPAYSDAYLAIGIENYLLGIRSAPARWILRASGAQTDKDKGIANIQITADKGKYLAPYARLLLVIDRLREKDRTTARKLLEDLARDFPQNRLYKIELARLQN